MIGHWLLKATCLDNRATVLMCLGGESLALSGCRWVSNGLDQVVAVYLPFSPRPTLLPPQRGAVAVWDATMTKDVVASLETSTTLLYHIV